MIHEPITLTCVKLHIEFNVVILMFIGYLFIYFYLQTYSTYKNFVHAVPWTIKLLIL